MTEFSNRPEIDAASLTEWLAALPPLDRVAAADIAGKDALALVGRIAEIRRQAVAEAKAQGLDVPLSATAVRDAVRHDREMLQEVLEILTRPGVSSASAAQLAQGLALRAPLDAVARRVLLGVTCLQAGRVTEAEHEQIMAAARRARQILPDG